MHEHRKQNRRHCSHHSNPFHSFRVEGACTSPLIDYSCLSIHTCGSKIGLQYNTIQFVFSSYRVMSVPAGAPVVATAWTASAAGSGGRGSVRFDEKVWAIIFLATSLCWRARAAVSTVASPAGMTWPPPFLLRSSTPSFFHTSCLQQHTGWISTAVSESTNVNRLLTHKSCSMGRRQGGCQQQQQST